MARPYTSAESEIESNWRRRGLLVVHGSSSHPLLR
jgi:hypothetical protein